MALTLTPASLVLVAVMTDPRDLEIARVFGWYRIPLKTAPKVIAVDYLAFYQTKAFGEKKWSIQYIAAVRGHELTTRGQLLQDEQEHPRAKDEYFKIQLAPLEKLADPISSEKWHRLTFLYTTGEYLLKARKVEDLVVQSDERQILWKALRDRLLSSDSYRSEQVEDIPLDDAGLALLLGMGGE